MNKNVCAVCQFCTYEKYCGEFVCHNEEAADFGKQLKYSIIAEAACESFTPHDYSMDLMDAYRILTTSSDGTFMNEKLPRADRKYSLLTFSFRNNKDQEAFRDAFTRIAVEYINKTFPKKEEGGADDRTE